MLGVRHLSVWTVLARPARHEVGVPVAALAHGLSDVRLEGSVETVSALVEAITRVIRERSTIAFTPGAEELAEHVASLFNVVRGRQESSDSKGEWVDFEWYVLKSEPTAAPGGFRAEVRRMAEDRRYSDEFLGNVVRHRISEL